MKPTESLKEVYFGYNGFIWFVGVVEDVNDPEQVSRVKVRILGHNPESKDTLKTDDLMWATVMMPTTSASVSGVGHSPHGLVAGSYVFGFWMDGEHAQYPVVMGSWHGIPEQAADPSKGFNDPDGKYPAEANQPDTSKLARGENTIEDIIDPVIGNPPSAYAAEYPHNKVYQTTSGHVVEFDDTPDAERIRLFHTSGSNIEIRPDGSMVSITADNWNITLGNSKARVTGELQIVVDGDADITVGENALLTVNKNLTATVGNTVTAVIGNDLNAEVQNNADLLVKKDVTTTVGGNVSANIAGSLTATVANIASITVPTTNWTGDINLTGDLDITGTSTASVDHVSAGISGKGHTHTDTAGTAAGTTSPPN